MRTLMQLRGVHAEFDKDYVAMFTGDSSLRPGNLDAPSLPPLPDRVRALPGVTSASIASVAVMRGRGVAWTAAPAGETITPAHLLATVGNTVSLDYVETMGMRVVRGRSFSVSDWDALQRDSAVPALVNQAFATRFFPSGNPLGQYFGPPANGLGSSRLDNTIHDSVQCAKPPSPVQIRAARANSNFSKSAEMPSTAKCWSMLPLVLTARRPQS